jgi:hypothetical protein
LLTRPTESTYTSAVKIGGVRIVEAGFVDGRPVLYETDGTLTLAEIATAYGQAIAELGKLNVVGAQLDVLEIVQAIPQRMLCKQHIARAGMASWAPSDVTTTAFGANRQRVLLISNDRVGLAATMRRGLAAAVCDFQPAFTTERAKLDATCKMTQQFVDGSVD